VVGLGNPGPEFEGSRHNLGADTVRQLARRHQVRLRPERRLAAAVGECSLDGRRVALAVPTLYMNESGASVRSLVRRFSLASLERLVVIHDELDLPPGRVKIKLGGGTAGHNGLKSVSQHAGGNGFVRVRVGIGKPPGTMAGADYVLRRPPKAERALLEEAVEEAATAVETIVRLGPEAAMNLHNTGGERR
jgi:PTH1 family peptidyl-tRNA hydrolase